MSQALSLFDDSIQQKFEAFHRDNPHVYRALVDGARKWKAAGHRHCAIDMLFWVLRYERGLQTTGEEFKLDNNFRSRYSRMIMADCPDLQGFFVTRELTAA